MSRRRSPAAPLARLELDAVRAQADDLRAEIDEYEQLRSGAVSIFEAPTLAELATLLIKSRIARGWTQGQLADALGIAERQVQRYESTAYRAASLALDALTVWNDVTSGDRCACSCHPRLADGDLHDYGFGCRCRQTQDDRRRQSDEWITEEDAYWASPEGERVTGERDAEEGELGAWLALHPDIVVRSHGGMFPEQWWGDVDDRSFYFRERSDHWRIELDLRPTGRFSEVWLSGDFDDPASFEPRSIDAGDVIAEGTTALAGYGSTPLDRLHFIVDVIRTHVRRQTCTVHVDRAALASLLGRPPAWCPSCGTRLSSVTS